MDFDEAAKTWDDPMWRITRAEAIAERLRASLPAVGLAPPGRRARALDFGCGTGLLSFLLRDEMGEIVMLDASIGMIEKSMEKIDYDDERRRGSGLGRGAAMLPVLGSIEERAADLGFFDLVYSMLVLHHVADVQSALRGLASVLRPGGLLRLVDLDREDGSYHRAEPDFAGHDGFDRAELSAMAEEAGFCDISFETAWVQRRADGDRLREYPMFLMLAKVEP
jgi:SAM-dependent methyltransferase